MTAQLTGSDIVAPGPDARLSPGSEFRCIVLRAPAAARALLCAAGFRSGAKTLWPEPQ